MRRSFIVSAALTVLLMVLAPSAIAANRVLVVGNDSEDCPEATFTSIQAAVTAADPGSTIRVCPGTYREMVTVAKNDLKIVGMDEPNDVIVEGRPNDPNPAHKAGFLVQNVSGVLIQGFTVQGFHEADILLVGANGNVIRNNRTTKSAHDGIQLNGSSDNLIEDNVSFNNDAPYPRGPSPTLAVCCCKWDPPTTQFVETSSSVMPSGSSSLVGATAMSSPETTPTITADSAFAIGAALGR